MMNTTQNALVQVERNYKDTVFRMLFNEEKNLLSLYNAVNRTNYTNEESIEINTLENAVYMSVKNDISFVFDFYLTLYEHQSTLNPNMPLRNLIYVSQLYQGMTEKTDWYSSKMIKVPTPRFVVFYNGTDDRPERWELKLSDMFERWMERPELEVVVTVININIGKNQELMEACRLLKEYAIYVDKVRKYSTEMQLQQAVERAVDECMEEGILSDFLRKNRAEAIAMSLFEYNEELHLKNEREIALEEGRIEGRLEGEDCFANLVKRLMDEHRTEELQRVLSDREYRKQLYKEYEII